MTNFAQVRASLHFCFDLFHGFGIGTCNIPTFLEADSSIERGCVLLDTICCEVGAEFSVPY